MESHVCNNKRINGYVVYTRKRKRNASESSKSHPRSSALSLNSEASKGKVDDHPDLPNHAAVEEDRPNASVVFDKNEEGYQEGAIVSDAGICGISIQHTLDQNENGNLLLLRKNSEVCCNVSTDKFHKLDENTTAMQQQLEVYTGADQTKTEKYAKLGAREKEKMALRNSSKGTLTSSRLVRPSGYLKLKENNKDGWSELELDALWIGVRRHGQGNWRAILEDPFVTFLKNKSTQDLSTRWEKEIKNIIPNAISLCDRPTHDAVPSAHQMASNIYLKPMVSNLLPQTLNQKVNMYTNWRPLRHQALQNNAQSFCAKRRFSSSDVPEPELLLGGHFRISDAVLRNMNAFHAAGNSASNPIQIETDTESNSS